MSNKVYFFKDKTQGKNKLNLASGTVYKQVVLAFFFAFIFLFTASSQTLVTSVAQNTIGKNQYAEVSYAIGNAETIDNFQAPQFKDWLIVSGPMNSTYQSNVNGHVTQRTTITYYLQPKRSGNLVVEGAKAVLNGKLVNSSGLTVKVLDKNVDNAASGNSAQPTDPFGNMLNDPFFAQSPAVQAAPREDESFTDALILRENEDVPEKIRNNLFIKVIPSKNTCYEGEPVMATYKVYTRLEMDANVTRRPSFSGFSAYDMEEPNQPYVVETVNGRKYKSWVIRKVQLYPLQSGKLSLDPVEVDCTIRFAKADKVASGAFDPYSQDSYTKVQYVLKSPSISITAQPLPTAGRPKDFAGAVGKFDVKAGISSNNPGKDDAVHYSVSISGEGNFAMVHAPQVQWPAKTEAYDAKETENLAKSVMPIAGEKVFDFTFLPHQAGTYTIPAVPFSYFDVASKSYKTISTQPVTLQVSNVSTRVDPSSDEAVYNWPVIFTRVAAFVLPALAIGLFLFLIIGATKRKKKQQEAKDSEAVRAAWKRRTQEIEQAANKNLSEQKAADNYAPVTQPQQSAHNQYMPAGLVQETVTIAEPAEQKTTSQFAAPPIILQAETLLWHDDHRLFYKVLRNDVLKFLTVKANHSAGTKNEVIEALKGKGADEEVLEQISSLLDECDATLYSPISNKADRQKLLEEAKFLLAKL